MLENSSDPSSKRQTNNRNRSNNRRNVQGSLPHDAEDRPNKPNLFGRESEGSVGTSNSKGPGVMDSAEELPAVMDVDRFCNSEAAQFMIARWEAALRSQNDPCLDSADRPVAYCSSEGSTIRCHTKFYRPTAAVTDLVAEVGHGANT